MANKEILLLFLGDLGSDQRCFRMARSLKNEGFEPIVVCDKPLTEPGQEWNGIKIKIISPFSHRRNFKISFAIFLIKLIPLLLFTKSKFWISEDCPPLFPSALLARFKCASLVYDSRELFALTPDVKNRFFRKLFWDFWEKLGSIFCSSIITVSPLMAKHIKQATNKEVSIIYNSPESLDAKDLKLFISEKPKLLYQGELRKGSGLKELLKALVEKNNFSLDIFGMGEEEIELKTFVEKNNLQSIVNFKGRLPLGELNRENSGGEIGIHLLEALSESFDLTLSNKIFEYLNLGIPVLLGATKAHAELLKEFKIGEMVNNLDKVEILEKLSLIISNYKNYSANIRVCLEAVSWDVGFKKFVAKIKEVV